MTVYLIEEGCPICGADVKGNDKRKFYCKNCNVLFDRNHISKEKRLNAQIMIGVPKEEEELERLKAQAKEAEQKAMKDKIVTGKAIPLDEIDITDEEPLVEVDKKGSKEKKKEKKTTKSADEEEPIPESGFPLESPDKIIASDSSSKMHTGNCHFVKKIHPENRMFLKSIEEGEKKGKEMCVCLRRKRAKGEV